MSYRLARWVAVAVSVAMAAGFLAWTPTIYTSSLPLGTLLVFGAILLLSTAVLLLAKGATKVQWGHNLAWGMGATVLGCYVVLLCLARTVGVGGYTGHVWHWFDIAGLALAVGYLLSYLVDLRYGGAEPPAYPEPDYPSVWQAQQGSDGPTVTTYRAAELTGEERIES
jgi:hypothetical protein